jgi:XTP/dITP diphosphohydrolase
MSDVIELVYVTSSPYKRQEAEIIVDELALSNGKPIKDVFKISFEALTVQEELHQNIDDLVRAEAKAAYSILRIPCFVEHAGLILGGRVSPQYPGALTKPMWNSLGDAFVELTGSAGADAVARAAVAYCDGRDVHVFTAETLGRIAPSPRGSRKFYWDTVFIPADGNPDDLTYAEIVEASADGLHKKVREHSQSTLALLAFLNWRVANSPSLWRM